MPAHVRAIWGSGRTATGRQGWVVGGLGPERRAKELPSAAAGRGPLLQFSHPAQGAASPLMRWELRAQGKSCPHQSSGLEQVGH